MANLSKTKALFAFTSPRTIEKIIPEIKILTENFEGQKWSGNDQVQIDFFQTLFDSEYYEGDYFNTNQNNLQKLITQLLTNLEVNYSYINWLFIDNSGFVLYFDDKADIKSVKDKLISVKYKDTFLFTVSGNGWGNGLNIICN